MTHPTITVTIRVDVLQAVAEQMRRIPPRDHETDQFVADIVHWFETISENNRG